MNKEPRFVDDGLMVYKNVTVYVCDADDAREGGYDVHLNVGDDDTFDHIKRYDIGCDDTEEDA